MIWSFVFCAYFETSISLLHSGQIQIVFENAYPIQRIIRENLIFINPSIIYKIIKGKYWVDYGSGYKLQVWHNSVY